MAVGITCIRRRQPWSNELGCSRSDSARTQRSPGSRWALSSLSRWAPPSVRSLWGSTTRTMSTVTSVSRRQPRADVSRSRSGSREGRLPAARSPRHGGNCGLVPRIVVASTSPRSMRHRACSTREDTAPSDPLRILAEEASQLTAILHREETPEFYEYLGPTLERIPEHVSQLEIDLGSLVAFDWSVSSAHIEFKVLGQDTVPRSLIIPIRARGEGGGGPPSSPCRLRRSPRTETTWLQLVSCCPRRTDKSLPPQFTSLACGRRR